MFLQNTWWLLLVDGHHWTGNFLRQNLLSLQLQFETPINRHSVLTILLVIVFKANIIFFFGILAFSFSASIFNNFLIAELVLQYQLCKQGLLHVSCHPCICKHLLFVLQIKTALILQPLCFSSDHDFDIFRRLHYMKNVTNVVLLRQKYVNSFQLLVDNWQVREALSFIFSFFKGIVKWYWRHGQIFQSLFTITLTFFQQDYLQIFSNSLDKRNMCVSLRFHVREKPEKYFLLSVYESYGPGPRFFIIRKTWV